MARICERDLQSHVYSGSTLVGQSALHRDDMLDALKHTVAIYGGKPPFMRPFMVAMADDHEALDIRRAATLLDWAPQHSLADELPHMVEDLKSDPAAYCAARRENAHDHDRKHLGLRGLSSALDTAQSPRPHVTLPTSMVLVAVA